MTLGEIMAALKSYGNENIKRILLKHGVKEPFFGVKVEHLKLIEKKIKKDYDLALQLYATKNSDAMYLAGLIADDEKMTKEDLQEWVKYSVSENISGYAVPWVAAGSKHGLELAMKWIDSDEEHIAVAGWSTWSGLVALKPDSDLPVSTLKKLIARIEKKIHFAKNRERLAMNNFIISVGIFVKELTNDAITAAETIGKVTVIKEGTACKVPGAIEYIKKASEKGMIGKKKKTIKC